jgi:hypothetical protein
MTRIVYAAPDYTPPLGVVVLPIDLHPAIVEDRAQGSVTANTSRREPQRSRTQTSAEITEYLHTHGPSSVLEIANGINQSHAATDSTLRARGAQFEIVGRKAANGMKGRPAITWGLRKK